MKVDGRLSVVCRVPAVHLSYTRHRVWESYAEAAGNHCRSESVPFAHREPRWNQSRSQREHGGMFAASVETTAVAFGGGCGAVSAARSWGATGRGFSPRGAGAGAADERNG